MLRFLRTEDQALGLSAPRLSALSVLVFRGPRTMGELARAEQVTPATISKLVADLERQGLVARSTDAGDARVRRMSATRAGEALLHEGRRRRVARLAAAVEGLDASDRDTLARAAALPERLVASGQNENATPRSGSAGRSATGVTASSRHGWKV
ncbi:MAG: MarR family winged helix-turn-helix transcriptional regulator [Gemmatimonadales bacterium]